MPPIGPWPLPPPFSFPFEGLHAANTEDYRNQRQLFETHENARILNRPEGRQFYRSLPCGMLQL